MNFNEKLQFQDDYALKYGENLADKVAVLPKPMQVEAFIERVSDIIDIIIGKSMPNFDETLLSDNQKEAIYKAKLEQAYYMANTEDYSIVSGVDFVTGQMLSQQDLFNRTVSPFAKQILTNAGLQYRGLNRFVTQWERWRRL